MPPPLAIPIIGRGPWRGVFLIFAACLFVILVQYASIQGSGTQTHENLLRFSINRVRPTIGARHTTRHHSRILHRRRPQVPRVSARLENELTPELKHLKSQTFRNLSSRPPPAQVEALIRPLLAISKDLEQREFSLLIKSAGLSNLQDLTDEVLQAAKDNQRANTITYNTAISTCRAKGNVKRAMKIFDEMIQADYQPDIATYNTLMGVCENGKDLKQALSLDEDRKKRNVKEDLSYLKSLAAVHGAADDWESALGMLGKMKASGYYPDVDAFNTVINACVKVASNTSLTNALCLLDDFENNNLCWNLQTENLAVETYAKSGMPDTAISLFNSMKRRTQRSYMAVLKAYAISVNRKESTEHTWKDAMTTFQSMKRTSLRRNNVIYNTLYNILGTAGQWELCLEVFASMERDGVRPNLYHYVTVLSALAKQGQWSKAMELVGSMEKRGIKAEGRVYSTLIRAVTRARDVPQQALNIVQDFEAKGVTPNPVTFVELIRMFGTYGMWEKALIYLDKFESTPSPPDYQFLHNINTQAYNAAIKACFDAKQYDKAISLYKRMGEGVVECNQYTYETMIIGLSSAKEWEMAVEVLEEARNDGQKPTESMYINVVNVLESAGKDKLANKYYEQSVSQSIAKSPDGLKGI